MLAGAARSQRAGRAQPWGPRVQTDRTGMVTAGRAGVPGRSPSLLSPQYGKKKLKYLPYNHQHEYFFLGECWGLPSNHTPEWPSVPPTPPPAAPSDPGIAPKPVRAGRAGHPEQTAPGIRCRRDPEAQAPTLGGPGGWGRVLPAPPQAQVAASAWVPHSVLAGLPPTERPGAPGQDASKRLCSPHSWATTAHPCVLPVPDHHDHDRTPRLGGESRVQLAWAWGDRGRWARGSAQCSRSLPPGVEGGLFAFRKGLALGLPGAREATALHIPPLPTHRGAGGRATAFAELPQKAPGGCVMRAKLDPPVCRSGRCLPCVRVPLQP